jgi:hypothetical protein
MPVPLSKFQGERKVEAAGKIHLKKPVSIFSFSRMGYTILKCSNFGEATRSPPPWRGLKTFKINRDDSSLIDSS